MQKCRILTNSDNIGLDLGKRLIISGSILMGLPRALMSGVQVVTIDSSSLKSLTLSGPRFFRYRKDRGGVDSTPPSILLKIGRQDTLYAHMLPLNFFGKIFSFEGARPEKGLKI